MHFLPLSPLHSLRESFTDVFLALSSSCFLYVAESNGSVFHPLLIPLFIPRQETITIMAIFTVMTKA